MATIKSFTDLEQSKKLAEILPIESADMWWSRCTITDFGDGVLKVSYAVEPCNISQFRNTKEDVPCWSLAALLGVLPNYTLQTTTDKKVFVASDSKKPMISDAYDNPVDACVAMIEKLNELNLL
jgi:hypothetical protein